jgi:hypothetical protein
VQIGRDTGWLGYLMGGLWHRAACLVGQDRLDAALQDYQHYLALARQADWDNGISLARHVMASLNMRQGRLDAARAWLDVGDGWCAPEHQHAAALRHPLLHATILLLDGRPAEAAHGMQKLPLAWLQRADDNDLVAWSELAALLATELGWHAQSQQLAHDMRMLDGADDHLPLFRRFRDLHFGPGQPLPRHDTNALHTVRTGLRASIAALHARLNKSTASTAAD